MEVNDLQSARDLNFRVELTNIDLCANFYLPSYSRDFNMPDINFPCKSSLTPPPFSTISARARKKGSDPVSANRSSSLRPTAGIDQLDLH